MRGCGRVIAIVGVVVVVGLGCAPTSTGDAAPDAPALDDARAVPPVPFAPDAELPPEELVTRDVSFRFAGRCQEPPRSATHRFLGNLARSVGLDSAQRNAVFHALPDPLQRFVQR